MFNNGREFTPERIHEKNSNKYYKVKSYAQNYIIIFFEVNFFLLYYF